MVDNKQDKNDNDAEQDGSASSWDQSGTKSSSEGGGQGPTLWLITFTDVMALMLTFFVLLYSMSVPKEEEWQDLTSALGRGFSKFESAKYNSGPEDTISIDKLDFSRALDLNYLNALVTEIIEQDSNLKNVVIIPQRDRLILSLPSDLLFESGQARVTTQGKKALFSLGGPLSRIRNRVEVIGHADPRPIQNKNNQFTSNWELSLNRAVNVAAVLENVGYERSVRVRGLSSGRYDELPTYLDEEDRLSMARRVDVVIMKDDGSTRSLRALGLPG